MFAARVWVICLLTAAAETKSVLDSSDATSDVGESNQSHSPEAGRTHGHTHTRTKQAQRCVGVKARRGVWAKNRQKNKHLNTSCFKKNHLGRRCKCESFPFWRTAVLLTLAVPRHSDGDCKGTVTDSYRSNFDWLSLGGTGSVRSIRAFRALVSPALMGAERISRGFLWGGVYFSAGEVLRKAVEKLALLIYMSTTAIEVNIS